MTATLRPMRPDDHDRVASLLLAAYDAVGTMTGPYRDHLGDPASWAAGATAALVAVDDTDRPVGCVAFTLPGDEGFENLRVPAGDAGFRFLAVDPSAQGNGAGRTLVRACVDLARALTASRMLIHSMEWMTAAHRLYLSEGFDRRRDLDVIFPGGVGYGFTRDLADDAATRFPPPGPVPDPPPWYEDVWAPTA